MMHKNRSRSILSCGMARYIPAIAALALGLGAAVAHAQNANQTQINDLNTQLYLFAQEESTTPVTTATEGQDPLNNFYPTDPNVGLVKTAPTIVSAAQTDLVYAVYSVLVANPGGTYFTSGTPNNTAIGYLVQAALAPITSGTKTTARADLATLVPRVVNAAILGAGAQDNGSLLAAIVTAAGTANSGLAVKYQLTTAEKEAVVAQALKSAGPAEGSAIENAAYSAAFVPAPVGKVTAATELQTFSIAVLNLVGAVPADVQGFTSAVLGQAAQSGTTAQIAYAKAIADGIAVKGPVNVGGVYAALGAQLVPNPSTSPNDALLESLFTTAKTGIFADTKLAKSVNYIFSDMLQAGEFAGQTSAIATTLATGQSVANQGYITAGAISVLSPGSNAVPGEIATLLSDIIAANSASKTVAIKSTNAASFAAAAATGTGDFSAYVAADLSNDFGFTTAAQKTAIAEAVLKAIAVTSPTSAEALANQVIVQDAQATTPAFGTPTAQLALAVSLAKTLPTNGAVTGAAVAGVGEQYVSSTGTGASADLQGAALGAATIKVAPASAFNIAYDLASLSPISTFANSGGTNGTIPADADFAIQLATSLGAAGVTYIPKIVAGIGAYNPNIAVGLTLSVIQYENSSNKFPYEASTLAIASAVATTADFEHLAVLAENVAGLLQPSTSKSTLPKITSLSALATTFAKAINARPLVATDNRANEMGELAAGLTQAVISNTNLGTLTQAQLASYFASIGTSLYSSLAAKQTLNAGVNALDLQDMAQNIAGAIAQTISLSMALTNAEKEALLESTGKGTLITTLLTAAKTWGPGVTAAFTEVSGVAPSATPTALGPEVGTVYVDPSNGGAFNKTILTGTGRYDDGAFVGVESPVSNLYGPVL